MIPNHVRCSPCLTPIETQEMIGIGQHLYRVFRPRKVLISETKCFLVQTQPP